MDTKTICAVITALRADNKAWSLATVSKLTGVLKTDVALIVAALRATPCFRCETTASGRLKDIKFNAAAAGVYGELVTANNRTKFYRQAVLVEEVHTYNDHARQRCRELRVQLQAEATSAGLPYLDFYNKTEAVAPVILAKYHELQQAVATQTLAGTPGF